MGKVFTIIVLLLIVAGGGYLLLNRNQAKTATTKMPTTAAQPTVSATGSPSATQNTVTLTQSGFSPMTLIIKAGQTVTWINKSGEEATINSDPHPVHTNYPPLNLGQFADGGTLTLTFSTPGTYGYHNHLNPSERGTIVVQ